MNNLTQSFSVNRKAILELAERIEPAMSINPDAIFETVLTPTRKAVGASRELVADAIGVTPSRLANMEIGKTPPSTADVYRALRWVLSVVDDDGHPISGDGDSGEGAHLSAVES